MATIYIGRTLSSTTDSVRADQGSVGASPWITRVLNNLVNVEYDEVTLSYNGQQQLISVIYKKATVAVATLTLTYSGRLLANVVRT